MAVAEQQKQIIIMKKSIFILAALFAATFANAQITLERTITDGLCIVETYQNSPFAVYGDIFALYGADEIKIVDSYSFDDITTLSNPYWFVAARGYFSNAYETIIVTDYNNHVVLLSESGSVIQDLGTNPLNATNYYNCSPEIKRLSDNSCKLILNFSNSSAMVSQIYSLPGNGVATEISTPSSPKRSARKIARDGQVLVQTDDNTYTLTGAEVK